MLIKRNVECSSQGENLGRKTSLDECANACRNKNQCAFFIYGIDNKKGKCWWEKTSDGCETEEWETDNYNFYKLKMGTSSFSDY